MHSIFINSTDFNSFSYIKNVPHKILNLKYFIIVIQDMGMRIPLWYFASYTCKFTFESSRDYSC